MRFFVIAFTLLSSCLSCFATLSKPKQYLPANNTKSQPTAAHLYVNGPSYNSGTQIVFQISENSSFSNPKSLSASNKNGSLTSVWFTKLKINQTYYWRVKAQSTSDSSLWSDTWTFETEQPTKFYFPSANGVLLNPTTSFSWYRQFEYDSVQVQLDTSSSFNSSFLLDSISIDTFSTFYGQQQFEGLSFGQSYYARYRGINGTKKTNWSNTVYGTVYDSVWLSTSNPKDRQSTSVRFYWNSGTSTGFQFQLDTTASFSSPSLFDTMSENTLIDYFNINNLHFDQDYYYRVRITTPYDTSEWSNRSFYTDGFKNLTMSMQNNASPSAYLGVPKKLSDIVGYQFQLDTALNFESIELHNYITTTDTRILYDSLLFGEVYYARCRPFHATDTGAWTKVKVFTTLSSISTSYPFFNNSDVAINDSLTWNYGKWGITHYQLQLSESQKFVSQLIDSTFDTSPTFIGGTTLKFGQEYHYRLRAWHSRDTTEWSGIFGPGAGSKFTTARNPNLKAPYNSSFIGTGANPTLVWNAMKGVSVYEVWLDTSTNFDSPILYKSIVSDTSALNLENLLFGSVYSWKVRAISAVDTSDFSEPWVFKVLGPARLSSPKNNATNITPISLDWNSISGTSGYLVHLDTIETFSNPIVYSSDSIDNSFFHYIASDTRIKYNQKYFWRVKVFHSKDTTEWSAVWSFTTRAKVAPLLVYPNSNASDIPLGISFTWQKYSGASTYLIQYSENPSFSPVQQQIVSSNSRSAALKPSTTYYWRVKSRNSQGQEFGEWSDVWSFTTRTNMNIPVLLSPKNNLLDASINQTLTWEPITGANYDVQYDDNIDFTSPISASTPSSIRVLSNLEGRKMFYWRVRAKNAFTTGEWSDTWSFTTGKGLSILIPSENNVTAFPNPVSTSFLVQSPVTLISSINIIDSKGCIKYVSNPNNNKVSVDLVGFSSGVYTVVIVDEHNVTQRLKLLKL